MIVQLDEPLFYKGETFTEVDVDRLGIALPAEDGEPNVVPLATVLIGGETVVVDQHSSISIDGISDLVHICEHVANMVARRIREEQEEEVPVASEE